MKIVLATWNEENQRESLLIEKAKNILLSYFFIMDLKDYLKKYREKSN